MTSKHRLKALEKDLQSAEVAYKEQLISALGVCASGRWGLLGANDAAHSIHVRTKDYVQSEDARALIDAGNEIAQLRSLLGYIDAFPMHERFISYRKLATGRNAPGEPKVAQQFLEEIERES